MPEMLLDLWNAVTGYDLAPEACLVNFYAEDAKMGLHQDRDEADFAAPLLSISLGDTARFRLGGPERVDPTRSFPLESGDVLMLAPPMRLAFHGVRPRAAGDLDAAAARRADQSDAEKGVAAAGVITRRGAGAPAPSRARPPPPPRRRRSPRRPRATS